jgi:hypothetical protein
MKVTEMKVRVMFLPRFHPELNPIELFWGWMKSRARKRCGYKMTALREIVEEEMQIDDISLVQSFFSHVRKYEDGYANGDSSVDVMKTVKKSHRKVPPLAPIG